MKSSLSIADILILGMYMLTVLVMLMACTSVVEKKLDRIIELMEPAGKALTEDKEAP